MLLLQQENAASAPTQSLQQRWTTLELLRWSQANFLLIKGYQIHL